MWRLRKSLEDSVAAQEGQTEWKRRMDLTGSRSRTSSIMSSGSNGADAQRDTMALFLLLLVIRSTSAAFFLVASLRFEPQDHTGREFILGVLLRLQPA